MEKVELTKDPPKETRYYLNHTAAYRSRRPDLGGYRSFISNLACVLNQGPPVTPKAKSQESWEAI